MDYLYGRRAVTEAIRANHRTINRLVVDERTIKKDSLRPLLNVAQEHQVEIGTTKRAWLDSKTDHANHQGVVLEARPYPYTSLDAIIEALRGRSPFLLFLDLLQDVQNVGTLLRTAEAVGVDAVVIQERRAASITPAVVNASSGAVEHLKVAQVTNLVRVMEELKQHDVWFAGLDFSNDAVRLDQANFSGGLALVVGSEGQGLRRLVRDTCDFIVYLPMRGKIESLNAAVAGSVALYAAWQVRGYQT